MPAKNQEIFNGTVRLYDADGTLVAEAHGVQLKRANQETLMRAVHRLPEDWLYRVAWEPKVLETLPGPKMLALGLHEQAALNEREPDYAAYRDLAPQLDRLSAAYILEAFKALGHPLQPDQHISTADLEAALPILPRYQPLLKRMMEILCEAGMVMALKKEAGWQVTSATSDLAGQAVVDEMISRFPAYRPEITLLARCGANLADVLRGAQDVLPLLFPQGSLSATEDLYARSPYARAFNALAAQAVARHVPADGPVRILEIGAGSGATTAAVLPHLPGDRAVYTFTDLSPLFLEKARAAFHDTNFMRYQILDIGKDPQAQGFAERSFDIVLAANVFHATGDLRQTVENARKLLAPGGLLVLLEGIRKESWVDLTFGLTEGWWQFKDAGLRPDYPLLSRDSWLRLLAQAGFAEVTSLPDADTGSLSGQEIFFAQAPLEQLKAERGTWIILSAADEDQVSSHLAASLRQHGQRCLQIYPKTGSSSAEAGEFAAQGADCWAARLDDAASYERLLAHAAQVTGAEVQGIVHLHGLSNDPEAYDAVHLGGSALYAMQALLAANQGQKGRLWLAVRDTQPVNASGELPLPDSAVLWGLGRTIAREQPELWGGLVACEGNNDADDAARLFSEIWNGDGEDQVVFRDGQRLVPRLERSRLPAAHPIRFQADASYLITGGLGGLGLKTAQWMARQGAKNLVLVSRRGLPPRNQWDSLSPTDDRLRQIEAVRAIESMGARVETPAVDIGSQEAARSLFQLIGEQMPPLRGIIHAAADLTNVLLADLKPSQIQAMFHPKIQGTWNLHHLSQNADLDFFVMFSSTTALLGSQYLGHYAAANSFLDAFAHYRRSLGQPAVSINWGTWDTMRAASEAEKQRVNLTGMEQMPSEVALDLLGHLLNPDQEAQVTVASVNWEKLKALYETRRSMPLLKKVADLRAPQPVKNTVQPVVNTEPTLIDQLQSMSSEERKRVLITRVRDQVARVIGSSADLINTQQGLFEMGLDSLMSVELKGRLEKITALTLPSTLTFNYPTVEELADYLLERIQGNLTPSEQQPDLPAPAQESPAVVETEDIDDLSEDELAMLLSMKLKGTL